MQPRGLRVAIAAGALLALVALILPASSAAAAEAEGSAAKTLADSGFRPGPNGYSFANYGNEDGYSNLAPVDMERMFGSAVCARGTGTDCVLTAIAAEGMESINQMMGIGHCMGFAVTAQSFFEGYDSPASFGSALVPDLQIDGNVALQRKIAEGWTYQLFPSVQAGEVKGKPAKILRTLRTALRGGDESYVLTIFMADGSGGHAITPFAISKWRPGLFKVRVYDNNWPERTRSVTVNTRRNTWRYQASINPSVGSDLYAGNRKTKTLNLLPIKPGLGEQPCFFCDESFSKGRGGSVEPGPLTVFWEGDVVDGRHGDLLIRNGAGRRAGCDGEGCFNEIPGADMWELLQEVRVWRHSAPPIFRLPAGERYSLSLTGSGLTGTGAAEEGLKVVGAGFSLGVSGVRLTAGETDRIELARNGRELVFVNDRHGVESPDITLTTGAGEAHYRFEVRARGVDPGSEIGFEIKPGAEQLLIDTADAAGAGSFAVRITRIDADGNDALATELTLRPGEPAAIDYGSLS